VDFPSVVKYVRKKLNMSQEDLARAINVSYASINRWENGKNRPNKLALSVFVAFCKQQGIDIDELSGNGGASWR
jgi:DNA-binding transcriptional regulator YiaG